MSTSFRWVSAIGFVSAPALALWGVAAESQHCWNVSRRGNPSSSMSSVLAPSLCRGDSKLDRVVVMSTYDEGLRSIRSTLFRPREASKSNTRRFLTVAASGLTELWHDAAFCFLLVFLLVWHLQGSPSSQRHRDSSSSLPTASRRLEAHMHPPEGLKFLVLLSSLQWPHVVDGLPLRLITCSGPSVWVHCAALWPLIHVSQAYLTPLITTILLWLRLSASFPPTPPFSPSNCYSYYYIVHLLLMADPDPGALTLRACTPWRLRLVLATFWRIFLAGCSGGRWVGKITFFTMGGINCRFDTSSDSHTAQDRSLIFFHSAFQCIFFLFWFPRRDSRLKTAFYFLSSAGPICSLDYIVPPSATIHSNSSFL